jgi:hypothetical protein
MKSEIGNTNNSILQKAIFIVLLLFSIHFWELRGIPQKYNVENLLTWMVCAYSFIMVRQNKNMLFKNAILVFMIGIFLNSIPAYINLGQSPYRTILSFEFYYFILLYFLLHFFKFNRKFVENVVIVFGIIYAFVFTFQYRVYPFVIFNHDVRTAQESWQFEILGHGFLMLAYFLVLNRYLLNRRLINIFIALGFFMVLIKSDFRTLIAGAILVTVLMLMRLFRLSIKDFFLIIIAVLLFVGLIQHPRFAPIFETMISKTQGNMEEGEKYVRFVELEYFYKRYPENISYFIFGGGKPSGGNLRNFDKGAIGLNYNIVWVDIGILGFYIVIGGIATLGLLWYTLKAIFIKLPRDRLYLNFYFLYLLVVSFTNEEIYRNGIFTVQAIGLYLIDLAISEKSDPVDETAVAETNS